MKCLIATLVVALAVPGGALAAQHDGRLTQDVRGGSLAVHPDLTAPERRDSSPVVTPDLRAPDARRTPAGPALVPPRGTDVAAPDQQAPVNGPRAIVSPSSPRSASDIDWGDAGLGAAVGVGLLALSIAAGMTLRRRASALAR